MSVAIAVAGLFGLWSMFAMMVPADSCTPDKCTEALVGIAYIVLWLGLPISVIVGLVGIARATKRKGPRVVPPLASLIGKPDWQA